jgi:hypothetical protein
MKGPGGSNLSRSASESASSGLFRTDVQESALPRAFGVNSLSPKCSQRMVLALSGRKQSPFLYRRFLRGPLRNIRAHWGMAIFREVATTVIDLGRISGRGPHRPLQSNHAVTGEKPSSRRCWSQSAIGLLSSRTARSRGCLPSSMASTMSGAKKAARKMRRA